VNIKHQQRGAVLIISMIILLLLTMLGVTSMRTTQLEERMAGNARDRHVAFEAAEAALVAGEEFADTLASFDPFDLDGSDGLYEDSVNFYTLSANQEIEDYVDWSGTVDVRGFRDATNIGTGEGLGTAPKYVIQLLTPSTGLDNPNLQGYGSTDASVSAVRLIRVTARGTGTSDNSVVILQTVYGVKDITN